LLVLIHLPVASVQKEKKKRKESISSTHFEGKYKQSQKKKKNIIGLLQTLKIKCQK
jgi:hypothetical protein